MLKISVIAPMQLIAEVSKFNDFEMTLMHLFQQARTQYEDALKNRKKKNPIYLDNSFFELGKSIEFSKLLLEANLNPLGIERIFLPDGDFSGAGELSNKEMALIPKTCKELITAFELVLLDRSEKLRVGISSLHARKEIKTYRADAYMRLNFVEKALNHFAEEDRDKLRKSGKIHFLGLNNDPWEELKILGGTYNATLDSSAFVWPFIKSGLKVWEIRDKFSVPVDFFYRAENENKILSYLEEVRHRLVELKIVEAGQN